MNELLQILSLLNKVEDIKLYTDNLILRRFNESEDYICNTKRVKI
jgi:hypothetical protein